MFEDQPTLPAVEPPSFDPAQALTGAEMVTGGTAAAASSLLLGVLLVCAAAAVLIVVILLRRATRKDRRRGSRRSGRKRRSSTGSSSSSRSLRSPSQTGTETTAGTPYAEPDVSATGTGAYVPRPLLNPAEYGVFAALRQALEDTARDRLLMAHVSLSRVVSLSGRESGGNLRGKRLDFGVFDRDGMLELAVIVPAGEGRSAERRERDAFVVEVLHMAGIPVLELAPDWSPAELRADLREVLAPSRL